MTNKINEWLTEEKLSELKSLADGGETMKAIATYIGITVRTLEKWRAKYPEIASVIGYRALSDGERVEKALLRRAVGYTQTEITRQKGKDGNIRPTLLWLTTQEICVLQDGLRQMVVWRSTLGSISEAMRYPIGRNLPPSPNIRHRKSVRRQKAIIIP